MTDRIVLSRRRALAGVAATAAALAPTAALSQGAGMDLTIIYVGAKDCGPCQVFKHQDFPQWAKSAFPRTVRFVEIDAPTTTVAYQARYWPSNVRFVLQQVKVPIVPTFFCSTAAPSLSRAPVSADGATRSCRSFPAC